MPTNPRFSGVLLSGRIVTRVGTSLIRLPMSVCPMPLKDSCPTPRPAKRRCCNLAQGRASARLSIGRGPNKQWRRHPISIANRG
jgi:hypothetical protein